MKTILVTGSSSGVGFSATSLFLEGGWRVIGLARRAKEVFSGNPHYFPIEADLAGKDLSKKLQIAAEDAGIAVLDAVLLNGSGFYKGSFIDLAENDVEQLYRSNVLSCFTILRWAYPLLKAGKSPQVLMITSVGGVLGTQKFTGLSAYSSSKGAQAILAECLAEEWKDEGIQVNALALGSVDTPMLREAFPGYAASMEAGDVGKYIFHWMEGEGLLFNGKVLQVSRGTP
ncbi:MAG: SDR family NAD(P)-dependent oxidoreductase [Bacteroidota bacterium]|jgi:NAD(P)-dependent dehydrogenase (short-subunit alcohol dehydrogenase family)